LYKLQYIALVRHLILSLRDPGKVHGNSKETPGIAIQPVGNKVRRVEAIEKASCRLRLRSTFGQVPLKNWWIILIHASRAAGLAARVFLSLFQFLSDVRKAGHSLREHFPGGLGLFLQSVLFQGPPHIVDLKLSFSFLRCSVERLVAFGHTNNLPDYEMRANSRKLLLPFCYH
jgi:hypothetical protein